MLFGLAHRQAEGAIDCLRTKGEQMTFQRSAGVLLAVFVAGAYGVWRTAYHDAMAENVSVAAEDAEGKTDEPGVSNTRTALSDSLSRSEPKDRVSAPIPAPPQAEAAETTTTVEVVPGPPLSNVTSEQYRDQMQAAFDAQSTDAEWSVAAASRLTQSLAASLPPGSTLDVVECRRTMCRFTAQHASQETRLQFRDDIVVMAREAWTGGALITMGSGAASATTTVAFLGRNGTLMPEPVAVAAGGGS
jgi:hypothetical protein